MKRLALLMVCSLLVFIGLPIPAAQAASDCQPLLGSEICLSVIGGKAVVSGPLGIGLSVDVPEATIEVPVPVYIEVPGPTVVSPVTVTETITRTDTVTQAPETITITETVTATPTGSAPVRQETTQRDRIATEIVEVPGDTVVETVFKNAAISIGLILLGILVALALMFIMYRIGRAGQEEQERSFNNFMRELSNLTMIRKR